MESTLATKYDLFLSHDWGIDENGRNNHHRVTQINEKLKDKGFVTWLDENEMSGVVRESMVTGMDQSKCFVVFLTKNYMEKVNATTPASRKDNCKLEVNYAFDHDSLDVLVVTLDDTMSNPKNWKSQLKAMLGRYLFVSMSGDFDDKSYFDGRIEELVDQLGKIGIKPSNTKPNTNKDKMGVKTVQSENTDKKEVKTMQTMTKDEVEVTPGTWTSITLALYNDLNKLFNTYSGTYILKGNVNNKPYWEHITNKKAIWYDSTNGDWKIGSLKNLGTTVRVLHTKGSVKAEHPYDSRNLWFYWLGKDQGFKEAPPNDVSLIVGDPWTSVELKLSNNLEERLNTYPGTYIIKDKINEKYYYEHITNKKAIWYDSTYGNWKIGSSKNLGTNTCSLHTKGSVKADHPYDGRNTWSSWVAKDQEFQEAPPNDVSLIVGDPWTSLKLELSNNLEERLNMYLGTYVLKDKINDKYYWEHITNEKAIWYDSTNGNWKVGMLKNLGKTVCVLYTKGSVKAEHPYDSRNSWSYWLGKDQGFKEAPPNDVSLVYGDPWTSVKLKLSNSLEERFNMYPGTYVLKDKIDEKYYWEHITNKKAIWYDSTNVNWKIGSLNNLGTTVCVLHTKGSVKADHPYDGRNSWSSWVAKDQEFQEVRLNDVILIDGDPWTSLKLELSNNVAEQLNTYPGTFILKNKVNDKYYWEDITNENAIWYDSKNGNWKVGSLKNLGTTVCAMYTKGSIKAEHPYDSRNLWSYWLGKDQGFKEAPPNDVNLTYGE